MAITFALTERSPITTVEGFIGDARHVRELAQEGIEKHKLWFRGHARSDFQLLPTIGRQYRYGNSVSRFDVSAERQLLHRFRRRAFPHDNRVTQAGYALFLARHHGLPTRILDWTANALFALYFTCMEHGDSDGHVWAFRQRNYLDVLDAFELVQQSEEQLFSEEPRRVKVVHPVFNSIRLIAQEGGFTLHSDPWSPLETLAGIGFQDGCQDVGSMYRWLVPRPAKPALLKDLNGLGISHRNVFPDLDGIARSLLETEVLWNGKSEQPA